MANKVVVSLEATTAVFDRAFDSADRRIATFNSRTAGSDAGLRKMEKGIEQLGFRLGNIEGPLGKVVEGLLAFSGGSALVVGVAAGIGVIAAAYKMATAEGEAFNAMVQKSRDAAANLGRTPLGQAIVDRGQLQQDFDSKRTDFNNVINSQFRMLQRGNRAIDVDALKATDIAKLPEAVRGLAAAFFQARDLLEKANDQVGEMLVGTFASPGASLVAMRQANLARIMTTPGFGVAGTLAGSLGVAGDRARFMSSFSAAVGGNDFSNTGGPLSLTAGAMAYLQRQRETGIGMANELRNRTQSSGGGLFKFQGITGETAALAGISALSGALTGGGIGSLLSGGLSLAGGAFGPVGSALGGLLGQGLGKLFGGRGEDPAVIQLRQIASNTQQLLEIERSKEVSEFTLINRRSGRDPRDIDAIRDILRDVSDRKLRVELV